ncbi:hypothetical protein GCM10027051_15210 [Niabella terrae]
MSSHSYYNLPLDLGSITAKKELDRCGLKESIAHQLHLILTTAFGELLSDPDFGNRLWEEDFDNISYRNQQKEQILQSLSQIIKKYESRLEKIKVEMHVGQEAPNKTTDPRIKRKLDFSISAVVVATNESIVYKDSFFVSPLSYN